MSTGISDYMRRKGLPAEPARLLFRRVDRPDLRYGGDAPRFKNGRGVKSSEENRNGDSG